MGETQRSGRGSSRRPGGDRESSAPSAAVLTPPTGLPAVGDLGTAIPAQRPAPPEQAVQGPPATTPAPPETAVRTCLCGHPEEMHEHYRAGDDCGFCGPEACASFRTQEQENPVRRVLRRWRP
ncbi:MAG: hypothetical protein L0I76_20410 [Pseudonocardia sp.]|nr:hypothetical protein [Pseudonocardia sp.]